MEKDWGFPLSLFVHFFISLSAFLPLILWLRMNANYPLKFKAMEENLLKIAEELTTLSQQLLKNNAKILQTITNMEQRHLKMEVYLIALQKKLQEVKKRTPEQEKHLQEITNIIKGL